jgi:hypothetical protein
MSLNNVKIDYDPRRIILLNAPFNKKTLEALRVEYQLENCQRHMDKHILITCNSEFISQVLVVNRSVELNGCEYKVVREIQDDENISIKHRIENWRRRKEQQERTAYNNRKGAGRGLLGTTERSSMHSLHELLSQDLSEMSFSETPDENNNNNSNSNDNNINKSSSMAKVVIANDDYVRRVERLMPDYFLREDLLHMNEQEKKDKAKYLIEKIPSLFKDYTDAELAVCPYPDMSLHDEVLRLTDELLTRRCERARPKKMGLRMRFTDEQLASMVSSYFRKY